MFALLYEQMAWQIEIVGVSWTIKDLELAPDPNQFPSRLYWTTVNTWGCLMGRNAGRGKIVSVSILGINCMEKLKCSINAATISGS